MYSAKLRLRKSQEKRWRVEIMHPLHGLILREHKHSLLSSLELEKTERIFSRTPKSYQIDQKAT